MRFMALFSPVMVLDFAGQSGVIQRISYDPAGLKVTADQEQTL